MLFWLMGIFLSSSLYAQDSKLIPLFLEASELYLQQSEISQTHVLKKELHLILKRLNEEQVSRTFLLRTINKGQQARWTLPAVPMIAAQTKSMQMPAVALHAVKFRVVEESDDVTNDDIYMYFFVTDGVVPTGKVTSIYKGLDEGDAFFFNERDRSIYPSGLLAKKPASHLLVDYGIMESDGDDIKEYQALSSIIIDLALFVYKHGNPESSMDLDSLRREVKALSQLLLNINHDDRLVTGTLVFQGDEIPLMLENKTYVEFSRKHKQSSAFDDFKYEILFRLMKDDTASLVTK